MNGHYAARPRADQGSQLSRHAICLSASASAAHGALAGRAPVTLVGRRPVDRRREVPMSALAGSPRSRGSIGCMPSEITVSLTPKSEYAALENFLDAQRIGLIRKVEGVSDERARQAPTASSLSLLGLIKHAATWEQRWFQVIMAGRQSPDKVARGKA